MDGTFHSKRGCWQRSSAAFGARLPLALLGAIALVCCVLFGWASQSTWVRLIHFENQFTGLKAESFYLGVRMRARIQNLNDSLLRYRLRGDTNDAALFRANARELEVSLQTNRTNAVSLLERKFFSDFQTAFERYEAESLKLLEAGRGWLKSTRAKEFQTSYQQVQTQSRHLLELCDHFINAQSSDFDDFLDESKKTLGAFRWLLEFSFALVLSLAIALMVLVYRGLITPLRHQLSESQAIIARQEKLASLGTLAAGVAHEIRNPLTAIKFRLFSLKKGLVAARVEEEDTEVISSEINRLERIVKDFLQFARPSDPELVDAPAQRILSEVHSLLKPQLDKAGIALQLEIRNPAWMRADTQQIKQVLINLVQNSADSVGREGIVTLRLRSETAGGRKKADAKVVLEVADNGQGIPPELQPRLFDPFFTTKEGGSGLGLPIAARIVEKHGGEIHYDTAPNQGTTFRIVLPRVANHET